MDWSKPCEGRGADGTLGMPCCRIVQVAFLESGGSFQLDFILDKVNKAVNVLQTQRHGRKTEIRCKVKK